MLQRYLALTCLPLLITCKPPITQPESVSQRAAQRSGVRPDERAEGPKEPQPEDVRPFSRCFSDDTALSPPRPVAGLLDRAADLYEQAGGVLRGRKGHDLSPRVEELLENSLICAEEAARTDPRSVDAHAARAEAAVELGHIDLARDAFARALALDPEDLRALAGAADLHINHLSPGVDHTETGLEYARHGSRRAKRLRDRNLVARLALLEGQALNDLGRPREALSRLDASLAAQDEATDLQARYERGVALFDLCRFEESRRAFAEVATRSPEDAWAHHHLGLVLEALGRGDEADAQFAQAHAARPNDFPRPLPLSPAEFRAIVDREAAALPPDLREDLRHVSLETADLPDIADLTAEEPPLSPTILGLYRGSPLGEPMIQGAGPRTIILYRKNLLRAVQKRSDLILQVRTTLLHELGHLRGEDDDALRARGLE